MRGDAANRLPSRQGCQRDCLTCRQGGATAAPKAPGTSSPRLLPTFAALSFGPSARPLISAMPLVTFRGGVLVFGAPLGKSPASLPRMRSTRPCRRGKRRTDWQRKTPQGRLKSLASASFAASGDSHGDLVLHVVPTGWLSPQRQVRLVETVDDSPTAGGAGGLRRGVLSLPGPSLGFLRSACAANVCRTPARVVCRLVFSQRPLPAPCGGRCLRHSPGLCNVPWILPLPVRGTGGGCRTSTHRGPAGVHRFLPAPRCRSRIPWPPCYRDRPRLRGHPQAKQGAAQSGLELRRLCGRLAGSGRRLWIVDFSGRPAGLLRRMFALDGAQTGEGRSRAGTCGRRGGLGEENCRFVCASTASPNGAGLSR